MITVAQYTIDSVPTLREQTAAAAWIIWGRDDDFQKTTYEHQYTGEIPGSDLVEVTGKHIFVEDSPEAFASVMFEHLAD